MSEKRRGPREFLTYWFTPPTPDRDAITRLIGTPRIDIDDCDAAERLLRDAQDSLGSAEEYSKRLDDKASKLFTVGLAAVGLLVTGLKEKVVPSSGAVSLFFAAWALVEIALSLQLVGVMVPPSGETRMKSFGDKSSIEDLARCLYGAAISHEQTWEWKSAHLTVGINCLIVAAMLAMFSVVVPLLSK